MNIKEHKIDDGESRFTIPQTNKFELLIAISKNGNFTWIRKGYEKHV